MVVVLAQHLATHMSHTAELANSQLSASYLTGSVEVD